MEQQQQPLITNEHHHHFNPSSILKTFSTRNKSSLSISTNQQLTIINNEEPSNCTKHSSSSSSSNSPSPHSSPSNHAPIQPPSPPPTTTTSNTAQAHPHLQPPNQHSLPTSSFGPNVAGRVGVGGNIMVDPYNPSHPSHRGNIGAGAFVYKVYNMLLDPSFQHLISFNSNGQSFIVNHVQEFSKTVLPKHFKHNNFSSFVRQLNMYGFHKVNKTPRGQRGNDNSAAWEFLHPKFHRGRPDLLDQIRRKTLDHDSVAQPVRKDHPHLVPTQSSPTSYRFPLDTFSFLPNLPSHPPAYQLVHAGLSSLPTHLPLRPKSDGTLNLSPPAPTHNLHIPDNLNPPLSSPSTLLGGSSNTIVSPNQSHLFQVQSSDRYPNPFVHSPYSIDHISSNTSQTSSAPITPLSAVPPPSSPLDHTLDPNRFSNNPIEMFMEIKNDVYNRFQGVHVSYEQLYQELHETRRRQKILIDLVEKMFKSLQSVPNMNVGYEFPAQELSGTPGGETTPIFKITEHDYPDDSPMITDDCSSQQQCTVSVGTSPSVSEFSHPNHTSPGDSTFRSFSVCPGGFGGLTLSSYPNSPIGGLMSDKQQIRDEHSSHSPQSTPMVPDRSVPLQPQTQQNDAGLLETEPSSRFLNPAATGAHHSQQHMRPTELNSVPISPREVLSAALSIPLPPSPAPFKPIHQGGASINAPIKNVSSQNHRSTDNYQHAINTFIHSHHPNLPIMGEYKEPSRTFLASIDPPNPILVKAEDCSSNLTAIHNNNHLIKNSSSTSSSFDKMVLNSSNDNLIFPSSSSTTGSPNTTLSHTHSHSEADLMGFRSSSSKKRPASNSMDLSAGISHLNHHHLNQINQHHRHQRN